MSFGGPHDPYRPQWPPHGGQNPPPPPGGGPYVPPPNQGPYPPPPPHTGPYVPPRPGPAPYGYPQPYPPQPYPPQPYPYPPRPRPTSLLGWGAFRGLRGAEWPRVRDMFGAWRRSNPGCMWLVLLAPCAWIALVPLVAGYSFARSARLRAHRLFPPRGARRIEDPQVTRLQKARAWTAAALSVLLLALYGKPEDVSGVQQQYMMRIVITPPLLLLSAPVVIGFLFRWATPATKADMRPRVRAAGKSALLYIGAVVAVPLAVAGIGMVEEADAASTTGEAGFPWLTLAMFLPLVWTVFFLGFATGPAVRTGFNTAAVHATLPALLTGVLVWEWALISLLAGGLPPGPPLIQVLAFLGGPASVTAVVWWELRVLRVRHGVALRA
ncbi:hypothetical protein ABZ354_00920 [Streptomyces sp. NPDC005925]|uniref:hypothetical protein n=1 Tax=Streptomyces sp. NPDC005925 TaxID=3157172 RepID=UPI0033EE3910